LVYNEKELVFAIQALEVDRVNFAFTILFHNVLLCFRALRNSDVENKEKFWITTAASNFIKSKERAVKCLRDILSYFPEIDKMSKFMHKYDEILQGDSENREF
jgi:hypothetical protein